jgi:hypothetical protein
MTGIVTLLNGGAEGGNVLRAGRIAIAPADCYSPASRDERQSTHPGAADSHEVDRSGIRGVEEIHL